MGATLEIDDLIKVLCLYPRKVRGSALGPAMKVAQYSELGIIVPAGTVSAVLCNRCDQQHLAEITTGLEGQGWFCPADGFVEAKPEEVAAFIVRPERLVQLLADQMDTQRRWAKPRDAPYVWSLGSFHFRELRVGVYFMLNAGELERFNEACLSLMGEPRCDGMAVITNDLRDVSQLILPHAGRVVSLADSIIVSDDGQIVLRREWLAQRVLPEQLMGRSKPGRPNEKQQLAADLIRELDRDGGLRRLGQNERHRILLQTARERFGKDTTLSKAPCDKAWEKHVSTNPTSDTSQDD